VHISPAYLDFPLSYLNKLVAPPSTEPGILSVRAFAFFTDPLLSPSTTHIHSFAEMYEYHNDLRLALSRRPYEADTAKSGQILWEVYSSGVL